ncbi:glycine cleavage system aminomethyltransferase GcvT [Halorarius litoreus]|uniref:glycine cleavage system aminomethyltransferase GcvT n=1 Tax=Halorarius litoreus TaxID=2962676 RepID=UPI0020CF0DB3|nr:glycine cleavage system aminomethyltransferase GcvT [Halorarius litoreus]
MALRKPPLREVHAERGAKFTEFGGWDMPVEFDSIRAEHQAVREAAGIFDVSHMSEIEVSGPDAETLMGRLTTNDVTALDPGEAQYSAITDEHGTILDDTVVYRLPEGSDADYLFVPNAGHGEWMHERWTDYRDDHDLDAVVEDATEEYAMFALQGPDALALASKVADEDLRSLTRFSARWVDLDGPDGSVETLVARTGYTGEDGVELLVPWRAAETVWEQFVPEATPCGLGARDTLRIEAGFLLSGQDFDHESNPRNPYEAGIGFVVKLDTEFVGRDALEQAREEGTDERFVGFKLTERGVPRHGYDIVNTENRVIGEVTSGTMSPTLGQPVGMGYLPTDYADPGTTVRVVVRGQQKKARIQPLPFYERQ